jgi:predicted transglutaminase-like cysteine proteinase
MGVATMLMWRRVSAMMLFGLIASAAIDATADSNASMFPGWKAVSSTNWDVKASGIQNWRQMLTRWADGKDCDSDTCSSDGWPAMVAQVKAAGDLMAEIKAANSLINNPAQHAYTEDIKNWNAAEYWETPYEFLKKSGDTEDFAIAKYFLLKAAGVPIDDMQIIAVRLISQGGIGHAILAVRSDSTHTIILDNRVATIMDVKLVKSEFKPVLGVNESSWSAYTGPQ